MNRENSGLEEKALSHLAEIGISHQLDEVEDLKVDVKTDPLNLIQGKADSITIEGEGMVMKKDLRMEEMDLKTRNVSINPLSAACGIIELTETAEASARVVLTEADINRAFNSDYIQPKLQNLQVSLNGKPLVLDTQEIIFSLPGERKIALQARMLEKQSGQMQNIAFTAVPCISFDKKSILLEEVEASEDNAFPELTTTLIEQTKDLLNLHNFELEGMNLRLQRLSVDVGKITIFAAAQIEDFPSA